MRIPEFLAIAGVVAVGALVGVLSVAVPAASATAPVLGVPGLFSPGGVGWGSARPARIYNGGVPSGEVRAIRWRRWGRRTADGVGWTSIYTPHGGYYDRPGRIQLRATDIGRCPGHSRPAYRHLIARVVTRPGGRYGRWFNWAGLVSLCSREYD